MKGKTKRGKLGLIFVPAVLLIAGAVAVWWFGVGQSAAPQPTAAPKPPTAEVTGQGAAKTPAKDEDSTAKYWTQLRLVRAIQEPFRLKFEAYDGDSQKPESMVFQINTIDIRQPSQFLKIGDVIAGTKFKIIKFESNPSRFNGSFGDHSTLQIKGPGGYSVLAINNGRRFPEFLRRFPLPFE